MKESFHQSLRQASKLHHERVNAEDDKSTKEAIQKLLGLIERTASDTKSPQKTQFEVLVTLQGRKQAVMDQLHEQLKRLDNKEDLEVPANTIPVAYDEEDGAYQYTGQDGNVRQLTLGTILSDIAWGNHYHFDENAPRADIKRYLLESAHHQIRDLLDEQIIMTESNSASTHHFKRQAYAAIAADTKSGEAERKSGLVAERIAEGLLSRIAIDNKVPFSIDWADAYEDVEHKADFFIHKEGHERQAKTDAGDITALDDSFTKEEDFAVQFSINRDAAGHKEHQLKRVAAEGATLDTILVIFSDVNVQRALQGWEQAGRPPGGPGEFLERHTKRKLFEALLNKMFSNDEILKMWGEVSKKL